MERDWGVGFPDLLLKAFYLILKINRCSSFLLREQRRLISLAGVGVVTDILSQLKIQNKESAKISKYDVLEDYCSKAVQGLT